MSSCNWRFAFASPRPESLLFSLEPMCVSSCNWRYAFASPRPQFLFVFIRANMRVVMRWTCGWKLPILQKLPLVCDLPLHGTYVGRQALCCRRRVGRQGETLHADEYDMRRGQPHLGMYQSVSQLYSHRSIVSLNQILLFKSS